MPLIKSAIKRVRQSETRQIRNRITKRKYRELIKEFTKLITTQKQDEAIKLFPSVQKAIDMAVKKNIIHQNNGARKKSALSKMINPQHTSTAKTELKTQSKKAAPKTKKATQSSTKKTKTTKK